MTNAGRRWRNRLQRKLDLKLKILFLYPVVQTVVKLIAIVAEEKTIVRIVARNGNGVIDVEIKEAIDTLKERVELIKKDYKREATDYLEVLEMAISALEKQIPKEMMNLEVNVAKIAEGVRVSC